MTQTQAIHESPRSSAEVVEFREEPVADARLRFTGIADVTVHLDGSARDEAKLLYAETVARPFGAHLTAFLSNHVSLGPLPPGPGNDFLVNELLRNGRKAGEATEAEVARRLSRVEVTWEVRRVDDMLGPLMSAATRLARTSDIFVLGRPYGEERHWPEFLEAVLFDAGATALVVPPELKSPVIPKKVVIGWRETSECAHAVAAALPFLKAADETFLVSVSEGQSDEERHMEPAADMAAHLARHGVKVEVRHLPRWDDAAAGILNETSMLGADLIVAGAYGRSRFREWLWGGVTVDLLTRSTVPLLLCH